MWPRLFLKCVVVHGKSSNNNNNYRVQDLITLSTPLEFCQGVVWCSWLTGAFGQNARQESSLRIVCGWQEVLSSIMAMLYIVQHHYPLLPAHPLASEFNSTNCEKYRGGRRRNRTGKCTPWHLACNYFYYVDISNGCRNDNEETTSGIHAGRRKNKKWRDPLLCVT